MQNESKKSICRNTLFSVYGILIDQILNLLEIPKPRGKAKKQLHTAFKEACCIETLTALNKTSLSGYIDSIRRYFAIEHGIYLRSSNEPEGVEEMTLSQYLKAMNDPKNKIFESLETLYNFHSNRERKRFLCDLTDTPISSTVGNEDRLMENIKEWLNFN